MPINFADDSNLFINGKDKSKVELELNEELSNIASWLRIQKLSLNINKIQFVILSRKRNQIENIVINIEGQIKERVTQSFLGVIIDEKPTWRNHVNHIISTKIAKGIGILIKARFLFK